jgi:hypothetical protein
MDWVRYLFFLIEDTEVVQAEMKEGQMAYLLSKFRHLPVQHLYLLLLTQRERSREGDRWKAAFLPHCLLKLFQAVQPARGRENIHRCGSGWTDDPGSSISLCISFSAWSLEKQPYWISGL